MYLGFSLRIPFCRKQWEWVWDRDYKITKNKTLEVQINRSSALIGFTTDIRFRGQDHAGPSLEISLFTWELSVNFIDIRHWNHEKWTWEVYDDDL